ncbi:hypothetical protein [Halorarius halobius]|uniref:hypothetical protein n=1 Tax=Halorarius halobius TaxID=2962671 RepID=UPI0020CE1CAC|nr:hypothetical protein [Halorarius halobius]
MPAFTSTCRCCGERLFTADLDAAWDHFIEHSEAGHDATFRRTARTRSHAVGSAPPHAD